jgi:hypothetical protein
MAGAFSVVLSLGPDPFEMERLHYVAAALAKVEGDNLLSLIVLDDCKVARDYESIAALLGDKRLQIYPSPRQFRGHHWRGGLATNYFFGFEAAFGNGSPKFIIMIDSDCLLLRSFAGGLSDRFRANADLGIIASGIKVDPTGRPPPECTWRDHFFKWSRRLRFRRTPFPRLETAFFGNNRTIRRLLLNAFSNGWHEVASPQGGAFAVSAAFYEAYVQHQLKGRHSLWLKTDLTYDLIFGLLCAAFDLEAVDDNGPGGTFAVSYQGLPFPPGELVHRGYAWVHSLKCRSVEEERALRNELLHTARLELPPVGR